MFRHWRKCFILQDCCYNTWFHLQINHFRTDPIFFLVRGEFDERSLTLSSRSIGSPGCTSQEQEQNNKWAWNQLKKWEQCASAKIIWFLLKKVYVEGILHRSQISTSIYNMDVETWTLTALAIYVNGWLNQVGKLSGKSSSHAGDI